MVFRLVFRLIVMVLVLVVGSLLMMVILPRFLRLVRPWKLSRSILRLRVAPSLVRRLRLILLKVVLPLTKRLRRFLFFSICIVSGRKVIWLKRVIRFVVSMRVILDSLLSVASAFLVILKRTRSLRLS